jgi:hypothetical protein
MMIEIEPEAYERLDKMIQELHYELQRYNEVSTLGLLYVEDDVDDTIFQQYIRLSDKYIKLTKNYYLFNFFHTDENNAIKAAENLVANLDKYFGNNKSYMAVDQTDADASTKSTFNRLYQILQETIKKGTNRVEDENILNELY